MSVLQIVVLAAIQGLAELLPVSSSAHVILAQRLMGLDPAAPEMTFLLVMLHTGTMFSVLVYFWARWKRWLLPAGANGDLPAGSTGMSFLGQLVVATGCTGVIGLGLKIFIERVILEGTLGHPKAEVEELFRNLPLIAAALLAAGILIIAAGLWAAEPKAAAFDMANSVMIGVVQGFCLPFRGFSRSGATISTALFCGIRRDLAEDFSFALAVLLTPPVILIELRRLLMASASHGAAGPSLAAQILPGLLGMVASFLAGLVALRWLSSWLEKGRWRYFGYYCVFFSVVVFVGHRLGL